MFRPLTSCCPPPKTHIILSWRVLSADHMQVWSSRHLRQDDRAFRCPTACGGRHPRCGATHKPPHLGLPSSGLISGSSFSFCSGQIQLTGGFFSVALYLMARVRLPDVSFSHSLWSPFVLNDLTDSPVYVLFLSLCVTSQLLFRLILSLGCTRTCRSFTGVLIWQHKQSV